MKRVAVILILFLAISCSEGGQMGTKRVVMIIAPDGFRDEELLEPKEILEKNGVAVTIASSTTNIAKGMLGAKIKPEITIQDLNIKDFDAVVFVGGVGAQVYWQDPTAHKIAKEAYSAGKVVAAICIAPVTLANAGLLNGKRATVWESEGAQLQAKGSKYTAEDVEKDGSIITANGPRAAGKFGKAILEALR
jgi:protease I